MLTYILFKAQHMLLSATCRKGQPDADLQTVQTPCQQQVEKASQMLTYKLFKTQSMLFSATCRKGQSDANLHSVQNPEHALVSYK